MVSDKARRDAVERLRNETIKHVGGRVSSEVIHREIGEIARREDAKEKGNKR